MAFLADHRLRLLQQEHRAVVELDSFFNLSIDMLCISSVDGYFKRLSPSFTQTLGWSVEEMLSRPYSEFVHPQDLQATLEEVDRQVRKGDMVYCFENRFRHKDGSWRWLSWRSVPHPGGLMYATARDVTHEKELNVRMERLVEERTAELRRANMALDVMADAAYVSEAETLRFVYVNQGACRQTGYAREELLGMTPQALSSEFTAERVQQITEALRQGERETLAQLGVVLLLDKPFNDQKLLETTASLLAMA